MAALPKIFWPSVAAVPAVVSETLPNTVTVLAFVPMVPVPVARRANVEPKFSVSIALLPRVTVPLAVVVIVVGARVLVAVPRTMLFASTTLTPAVVALAPPRRTRVVKSLVTVGRLISAAAFSVTVPVERIAVAAVWLMEPAVEFTNTLDATAAALAVTAGSVMLPPLVSVVLRVEVCVIAAAVIVPVAAGADSVRVELDEIAPVVIEPVEAVNVVLDVVEMAPVEIVPAETVRLFVPATLPIVTVPVGAERLSGLALFVTALVTVIEPAGAETLAVEEVVSAPTVMLPPVAVMFEVPPAACRRVVTEIFPAVEMDETPPDWITPEDAMLPKVLGALIVSVLLVEMLPALI